MKLLHFLSSILFTVNLQAATIIQLKVKAGDSVKKYRLDSAITKKDQFAYFFKKAGQLKKYKTQTKKFCVRNYIELELIEGKTTTKMTGCLHSKEKMATGLITFANMVHLEYGK